MSDHRKFSLAPGIRSVAVNGRVYIDIDAILEINNGIAEALTPDEVEELEIPPAFLGGVSMALNLYREIYAGVMARHAADIVPNYVPDELEG